MSVQLEVFEVKQSGRTCTGKLTSRYSQVNKAAFLKFDGGNFAFIQSSKRKHSENNVAELL